MDEGFLCKSKPKNDELGNIVKQETNCFHLCVYPLSLKKVRVVLYENYLVVTRLKNKIFTKSKRMETIKSVSPAKVPPKTRTSRHMESRATYAPPVLPNSLLKSQVIYLPIPLTWLIRGSIDSEQTLACQKKNIPHSFTLIWPEGSIVLATAMEKERNDWITVISNRIEEIDNVEKDELENMDYIDKRGAFQYENGGIYKGQWRNGRPHGVGKYTDALSITTYQGLWNADFCTGIGTISSGNQAKPKTGWIVNLPEGIQEKSLDEKTLSAAETDSIIRTGYTNSFQKGDTILREGEINKNLWWIQKGSVSIKKYDPITKQTKFLGSLNPSNFFGELSLIDKQQIISVSVVADTDVEITILHIPVLLSLFQSQIDLSKKFYWSMAVCLAQRFMIQSEQKLKQKEQTMIDTWTRLRRQITFSGMLLSTAISKSIETETEKTPSVDPLFSLARKFLQTWSDGKTNELMQYFAKKIIYLDPYVPSGCQGYDQLSEHLTMLLSLHSGWRWDIEEYLPLKDEHRCTLRVRIYTEKIYIKLWGMVLLSINGTEITQCEIYFDRQLLNEKLIPSESKEMTTEAGKAIEYRRKFGLTAPDEVLFAEYSCSITLVSFMELQPGSLYVSSRHICFLSQMHKMEIRKVIPVSLIKTITPIEKSHDRSGTFKIIMAKDGDVFTFTFNPPELAETASKTISAVISSNLSKENILTTDVSDYVLSWVKNNKLGKGLPKDIRIRPVVHLGRGIRLEGPKRDNSPAVFGTEVCGRAVSNYPYKTFLGSDGKRIVDESQQEGLPICDQFCLERYENQTIFALADGCSWGMKPKYAAYYASRRFVEFMSMHQSALLSVGDAANLCFEGISSANAKIMEGSSLWWEKGTTTLIGGAIVMIRDNEGGGEWALIAAGVGDCKAFHFRVLTDHVEVEEITVGSRNSMNILDATDPGGRLGPFVDKILPDLRNLNCWYRQLNENDVVMICTDGVHDNFDPQMRGISATDLGLPADWDKCDPLEVVKVKSNWCKENLARAYEDAVIKCASTATTLSMDILTEHIISICQRLTESSRLFMQQNPEKALPNNYAEYPGKLDHCTCVCIRVSPSSMQEIEQMLDSFALRMRHPINGITLQKWTGGDPDVSNHKFVFPGKELVKWFTSNENTPEEAAENMGQLLQNFKYLRRYPTLSSNWCESFTVDALYEFQAYEPVLTEEDLIHLARVGKLLKFKKNQYIIQQGQYCDYCIFHIIKGSCRVTRRSKENPTLILSETPENTTIMEPTPLGQSNTISKLNIPTLPTNLLSTNHSNSVPTLPKQIVSPRQKSPPSPTRTFEPNRKQRMSGEHRIGFKVQRDKSPIRGNAIDPKERSPRKFDDEVTISILKEHEIFGEVGFLDKVLLYNVSVIADSDCEVNMYDKDMIELVFLRYPDLEARFYHFLSSIMAQRLKTTE